MAEVELTYLDSSVLLSVAKGGRPSTESAMRFLEAPGRRFVASPLVRLEALGPETAHGNPLTLGRLTAVMMYIHEWVPVAEQDWEVALELASSTRGLNAADAIHLAICKRIGAVFANAEKATKAPNRCQSVRGLSILE